MKSLVIVLLATLLEASPGPMALAQSTTPATDQASTTADTTSRDRDSHVATPSPDAAPGGQEAPAASPRTVETPRILGMRASMVIFGGAVLFFVVVLFAAEISRRTPRYRKSDIDPRR
jgi:hypothetical protein